MTATTNSISAMNKADLYNHLNSLASRLAGVEEILRHAVESSEEFGNALYLMADVVADTNEQICLSSERMDQLFEAKEAQQ